MHVSRLVLAVLLAAPAALAQPTPVPGGAGVGVRQLALHEGRVVFLRSGEDGAAALVHLDPATGRAAEMPLPARGDGLSYEALRLIAGRLYVSTLNEETYESGPLLALDGPAFRPAPADAALAAIDPYWFREVGGRTLAVLPTADEDAKRLAEVGPDGRVTPLEPPPPAGGRDVYYGTPLGEAVYFAVEALDGDDYVRTLWRASGGRSAPADVLPPGAGDVSGIAAAAGALYVASRDRTTDLVRVFRLAPGEARAVPVPGFETQLGFSQGLFRAVGDALYFSAPAPGGDAGGDGGPRLALYRQRGASAPEPVAGLDLGDSATFFADAVREVEGVLYVAAYPPNDPDPYGTKRSVFRVGADGPAALVARIEDVSPQLSQGHDVFVVAGGRLYFVAQDDDSNDRLLSVPLADVPAPATRPRR